MINLDLSERRRNVDLNESSNTSISASQRQRHPRCTMIDASERSVSSSISTSNGMILPIHHKSIFMDSSECSNRMNEVSERKTKGWKRSTRSGGQRSFLLIFISFLCGMRLSFEFFHHYIRFLSSSSS